MRRKIMSKVRYELEDGEIQLIDIPQELINKINKDSYNQALEDMKKYILNSCDNVTCREDINADNDFDFYASELLDMIKEMKK